MIQLRSNYVYKAVILHKLESNVNQQWCSCQGSICSFVCFMGSCSGVHTHYQAASVDPRPGAMAYAAPVYPAYSSCDHVEEIVHHKEGAGKGVCNEQCGVK